MLYLRRRRGPWIHSGLQDQHPQMLAEGGLQLCGPLDSRPPNPHCSAGHRSLGMLCWIEPGSWQSLQRHGMGHHKCGTLGTEEERAAYVHQRR